MSETAVSSTSFKLNVKKLESNWTKPEGIE